MVTFSLGRVQIFDEAGADFGAEGRRVDVDAWVTQGVQVPHLAFGIHQQLQWRFGTILNFLQCQTFVLVVAIDMWAMLFKNGSTAFTRRVPCFYFEEDCRTWPPMLGILKLIRESSSIPSSFSSPAEQSFSFLQYQIVSYVRNLWAKVLDSISSLPTTNHNN